jgi:uncharacterized Zn-binding protein involved in type VI secretion
MKFCSVLSSVVICLSLLLGGNTPVSAASQSGTMPADSYQYYDIALPTPQAGLRLVLSTTAPSDFSLYSGIDHAAGVEIAASNGQTLHTLLVSPTLLADGGSYHVRIKAYAALDYTFTEDLTYVRDLAWDAGSALAGTSLMTPPDGAGGDYLFRITGQVPLHPGWRSILKVTGGEADMYLQQDSPPLYGGSYSSTAVGSDIVYLNADQNLAGQTWYLRVHATPGAIWQLSSGDLYVQELTWDNGSAAGGTSTIGQPATSAGDYFFRITSQTSAYGAWRTVLNVLSGEADIYLLQTDVPFGDTSYKSFKAGSDGVVLAPGQFGDNQSWYIRVHVSVASTWNVFSGDIYVKDLGVVQESGTSATVQIGPEGTYYFKNGIDANTSAWRIWLSGVQNQMYVSKGKAPVKNDWTDNAEQSEAGQLLLVPPYLASALYVIGVQGVAGSSITIDSRKQPILIPNTLAGYTQGSGAANFDFTLPGQGNSGGFGYITYRIDVPVEQIAWQINVTPGVSGQNPDVYIRKGDVPNRWMNDAFSEAPADVVDSISQVPPTLTDGAWYVTVFGSGTYSFSLVSKNPVITGATFINTSEPNPVPPGYAYPYNTVPLPNGAQFVNQSGWRYYQVSDINSQLGFLGWQLDLANHVPSSEIALRRNAVPARWSSRNGGSSYNPSVQEASHIDVSSTLGFLQHPGHQADIWYMGVYTPNQALGAFQLTTREIPAPLQDFATGSVSVNDQYPTTWQWFKYTVPVDAALKGWDLRLKASGGTPQMVVRRDQLPGDFTTSNAQYWWMSLPGDNIWSSGSQWAASPGSDWTGRSYVEWAPTYVMDKNGYLIMGLGSPLEPGTYYVGVSRAQGSSDATPLSYTLESRGIGLAGSSYPVKIQDLAYAGGTASGIGLVPREVGWYRVVVPLNSPSWSVNLVPTQGEALLAVRQGALPNVNAYSGTLSDDTYNHTGTKRQKNGAEYFYKYAPDGQAAITAGEYYLAVISEGQNPADNSAIGTGSTNYTVTSVGAMPINDKSATPVSVGSVVSWSGQSLPYAAQKVYRFRVPAGLTSVEVRFKNKVGVPVMSVRQDGTDGGNIANIGSNWIWLGWSYGYNGGAHEGGWPYSWDSIADTPETVDVVTIASPQAGDYTITVAATFGVAVGGGPSYPDATYDLEVEGMGTVDLPLANGSKTVAGQDTQTWRYFKVTVPVDATLKGWDLRLKANGGTPQMVVRRDQLPGDFSTSCSYHGCYASLPGDNIWNSGSQWGATPGSDWTGRSYVEWAPTYISDKNGYLIMGLGSPLEPGTYYVGVSRAQGSSDATPLSYTLESRGIGLAGSNYPVKIQDLAYAGGTANGIGLVPREVGWYRVVVPPNSPSWSVNLVPTQGEALLAVRQGALPNVNAYSGTLSDDSGNYTGTKRQKSGAEYFYKYAPDGQSAITAGEYYLAVISEGENPADNSAIGTGSTNYTVTSVGTMPINDKSATPVSVGSVVSWSSQSLPYAAQKVYRFRVPAGLTSVEVRFKNKVGVPVMSVRQDGADGGYIANIPLAYKYTPSPYNAHEGGWAYSWDSIADSSPYDALDVVTIASPLAGDYTVTVAATFGLVDGVGYSYPDASYDLEVRALTPVSMPLLTTTPLSGHLIDQQVDYYQVEVPELVNGYAIAGWKIHTASTVGTTTLRVAKGTIPNGVTPTLATTAPVTIVAPPYLSPGTWFVEVQGNGMTDYTISSDIISADPAKNRRSWPMPDRNNLGTGGVAFTYPPGLSAPDIGDSGLDSVGNPIINPVTGDQGTDLAQDDWHFYRITVPGNNGGHLRTIVEALSGTPELFLRSGSVPSPYHRSHAIDPNDGSVPLAYDRLQSVSGTMYGNWVPLDRRTELQLKPGDWWLGIKAVNSNIRYRLRVAAGNVRDANGPVDNANSQLRLVQDMELNGGSYPAQSLVANNMRYYRITVPQSSTTLASSTPLAWNLTLQQQVGDVAIFFRDTIPPGQGQNGNSAGNVGYAVAGQSSYFQDWHDDNSYLDPSPYVVIDTEGSHTITTPPLRPGATYYLGVYAKSDATFDISSAIGGERLTLDGVIPFFSGSLSATLPAGVQRLYRIDVPADALLWHHTAQHDAGVKLYLAQGTVPPANSSQAHLSSCYQWDNNYCQADSGFNKYLIESSELNNYPWQPGNSYYLLVVNTTGGDQPFAFAMDGRNSMSQLNLTVSGNGTGVIRSSWNAPDDIACSSGSCSKLFVPFTQVTLWPDLASGTTFDGWGGDCAGQGWFCTLTMDVPHSVSAVISDTSIPVVSASPAGGSYHAPQSIVLTSTEPGTIYYTLDGSDPTTSPSRLTYTDALPVVTATTIRFHAVDNGGNSSDVVTEQYSVVPLTTLTPAGGIYHGPQSVTMTASEPATIRYTLDGSDPQSSATAKVYSVPLPISSDTTLKFYSQDAANNKEPVRTATYIFMGPITEIPVDGLKLWLRADSGIVADQGSVTAWYDLSGNGNNANGAGATVVANEVNGQPMVKFDGSNIYTVTPLTINAPYTILTVSKQDGSSRNRLISSASTNWLLGYLSGNEDQFYAEGWVNQPSLAASGSAYLYSATGSGAFSTLYRDGFKLAENANGLAAPGTLALGGYGVTASEASDGKIAEVIVYDGVLTDALRTEVESYLKNRYNLRRNLALTFAGSGKGSVSSTPAGITCVDNCSADFLVGDLVTLAATSAPGSLFSGWSGACNGSGACQITMDAAKSVTATFADVQNPVITGFTLPPVATSATVAVSALVATDNVAVTGYLLTETAALPSDTNPGWSAAKPGSYTFSGLADGVTSDRTLYAWARDAAGNISASVTASTTITLPDITKPVITAFAIPAVSYSATVTITTLAASDNIAVTAYLLSESANAPAVADAGWSAIKPASYVFSNIPDGIATARTLYAWAKDAAGNVSSAATAATTITLPDITKPTVDSFTMPAFTNSLTVTGISIIASDNLGVAAYLLSEVSTPPSASAAGWSATKPTSHTFPSAGSKSLYAFVKDAADNVSDAKSATVVIDIIAPQLVLSTLADGAVTNKNTLNISGTVTDASGMDSLIINGSAITISPDGSFSHAITLVPGSNIVTTVAEDLAGNKSSDVRTIKLDLTAPQLTVTTPADNGKTAQVLAAVTGSVDETSTVVVKSKLNGSQSAAMNGNDFSATVNLENGLNTIEIIATDLAGNSTSAKRTVTHDPLKPTITISSPANDVTIHNGKITVSGTADGTISAIADLVITADGKEYHPSFTGGSFIQEVTFSDEKLYPVTVTVTDEAGNSESVTRNVIFIKGTMVINGGALYTVVPKVTLSLGYYPSAAGMQFLYNGVTWTKRELFAATKVITLPKGDGPKVVKVRYLAEDNSNLGEYDDTIIMDTKVPTGSLVINGGAKYANSRTVSLEITATDVTSGLSKLCVREDKVPCGETGFVNYVKTVSYDIVSPEDGKKTVYVTLRDLAGKTSKPLKGSITLDTLAPVGNIVINGGKATTLTPLVALKLKALKAAEMQLSLDGVSWGPWEKYTGSKKVTLPGGGGEKTVKVRFRDLAGNESPEYQDSIILQ